MQTNTPLIPSIICKALMRNYVNTDVFNEDSFPFSEFTGAIGIGVLQVIKNKAMEKCICLDTRL